MSVFLYQGLIRVAYVVDTTRAEDQKDELKDLVEEILVEHLDDEYPRDRILIDPDKAYIEIAINDEFYGNSAPYDIIDDIRSRMGPDFLGSIFVDPDSITGHIEVYSGELADQVVSKDAVTYLVNMYVDSLISDLLTVKEKVFKRIPPQETEEIPF